ncbi:hypothetical protein RM549_19015 [Salegentibacter sp. F188]|uniref:Uncharacterized protein n=1 Tax=Autumnicola patrickiae TaxID=3075591 RepID=A0ABU3E7E9_9FLAO|nr:hypothetical protein [Salegentibacter sp. F188]MDT0691890.1 hypothetical protein [Salegentibacter sp. F188]
MAGINNKEKRKEQPAGISAQPENNHQEIISHPGWMSLIVFGAVILLLGLFFFLISTYISSKTSRGLGIMTGTLVMRICLEFVLIRKKRFPVNEAPKHYKQKMTIYYENRRYMHFIISPLLLAAYIYGFAMLLSILKQELLEEFYIYLTYALWIVFFGLTVLIGLQLRKELKILKLLISDNKVS